jgi:hypothetical protein
MKSVSFSFAVVLCLGASGCNDCGMEDRIPESKDSGSISRKVDSDQKKDGLQQREVPGAFPIESKESKTGKDWVESLKQAPVIKPGMALHRAHIKQPSDKEMSNPRWKHLPEATRRSLIIMNKLQQKAPALYKRSGKVDPQIDESKMVNVRKNKRNR